MHTLKLFNDGITSIPAQITWYLSDLSEAKGKQQLYTLQSPQKLKVLKEHALIESAVSSNRIEGVPWKKSIHSGNKLTKSYILLNSTNFGGYMLKFLSFILKILFNIIKSKKSLLIKRAIQEKEIEILNRQKKQLKNIMTEYIDYYRCCLTDGLFQRDDIII